MRAVVVEHGEDDGITGDNVEELPRAGEKAAWVLVRKRLAVELELPFKTYGVCGNQHRARLGKLYQHGLMTGGMPACFDESNPRDQLDIAIDEPAPDAGRPPVRAAGGKALVPRVRQFVVLTLDDVLCIHEALVASNVVDVEMRANHGAHVVGAHGKF